MAVAYDAVSESHSGTSGSTFEASFSWTHTPSGTPRGVTVFVFTVSSSADWAQSVTYGGVVLNRFVAMGGTDTASEPGRVAVFHLGAAIPTGAQTVVVTRNNDSVEMYAIAVSVTEDGSRKTHLHEAGFVNLSENQALTEQSVSDGSPGQDSVRLAGLFSGSASPGGGSWVGANSTFLAGIVVGSARGAAAVRETTAGQGSRPVGFDSGGTSDDVASTHLAVRIMLDDLVGQGWAFTTFYSAQPRGPYWASTTKGAIIGVDFNDDLVAWYTSDAGVTWTKVVAESGSVEGLQCHFDRDVPGDTGTLVHVCWTDSAAQDLSVAQFDVNAGTWSAVVDVNASLGATYNVPFVVKTLDGRWVIGAASGSASVAYRNAGDFLTFGDWQSCTAPYESGALDYVIGFTPKTGDNKDAGLIFEDTSANEVSVKIYDWDGDTWTEKAIATLTENNATTFMGARVRHSDGRVFVCCWNETDSATADIKAFSFDPTNVDATSLTINTLTDVLTDTNEGAGCDIFIDQSTGDLYVVYFVGGTFGSNVTCYYKKSTDGGSTWGSAVQYSQQVGNNFRSVGAGSFSAAGGGRFQPFFYNTSSQFIWVSLANDIEIAAAGGGDPEGSLIRGKLINGGLLVNRGVLVG